MLDKKVPLNRYTDYAKMVSIRIKFSLLSYIIFSLLQLVTAGLLPGNITVTKLSESLFFGGLKMDFDTNS